MLHLIRTMARLPVIFFREHGQNKKYEFADRIIHEWNLRVYDYPPSCTGFMHRNGKIDGIGYRDAGAGDFLYVAIELAAPVNGNFVCALDEITNRPTIKEYDYKWDLTFVGSKGCDNDPILGRVPLKNSTHKIGNTILGFPLSDWSNKDIWEYTEMFNVPYESRRYDKNNEYREFEDKRYNNNYHYACTDCLNPKNDAMVWCRLVNKPIKNISDKMRYEENLDGAKKAMTYIDFKGVQNA